jgi:hypothetical protein
VIGLLLDAAQAVIGFENRVCSLGDESTTTRMRADTKALTSIVVACLVEFAQRGNPVGFRRRISISSVKTTALIFSGQMAAYVCRPIPKKVEPKISTAKPYRSPQNLRPEFQIAAKRSHFRAALSIGTSPPQGSLQTGAHYEHPKSNERSPQRAS